jgi:hypothetical protein
MGHFASQCLKKKKKKNKPKIATSVVVYEFAKVFEEYFFFIGCMSSAKVSDMWFVYNGASFHMTGCNDFLTRI